MDEKARIHELVEKITSRTKDELEREKLVVLKRLVKKSDDNVEEMFQATLGRLRMKNCRNRFLSMEVLDEFFSRSKVFRRLVVDNLDEIMAMSVGHLAEQPLPKPIEEARRLQLLAFDTIQKWNEKHGTLYRELSLAADFLNMHPEYHRMYEVVTPGVREASEQQDREKAWDLQQFQELARDFESKTADMRSVLRQIHNCFEMMETQDHFELALQGTGHSSSGIEVDADGNEWEEVDTTPGNCSPEIGKVLSGTASEAIEINLENEEARLGRDVDIYASLQEWKAFTERKLLPRLQNWVGILTRVQEYGEDTIVLRRHMQEYESLLKSALLRIARAQADAAHVEPSKKRSRTLPHVI
uniref:Uncharacterized protein n=1 Tax=Picocystis salinarum TaxID=88271 RepID=A0A7S3UH90_9CHLO|mmetsp:Transcript_4000/g.25168  ORF Transcript_4000/g.25168 Transcript_4000/m.25168 type:complete len:357 (+) Transcript_4000:157-1227(+)